MITPNLDDHPTRRIAARLGLPAFVAIGSGHATDISVLILAYAFVQFFRSFVAVIAPELTTDLGVSLAQLGVLSSVYFACSAVAQLPLGIALDRFGAGATVGWSLLVGSLAALAFSLVHHLGTAIIVQAILGLATAPALMGLLYFVGHRYSTGHFVVLSGLANIIGFLGNIVSGAPFGWLVQAAGWRAAVALAAALMLVSSLLVIRRVRDRPSETRSERLGDMLSSQLAILGRRELWPIIPFCFVSTGIALAFRTVWGGPYLRQIFDLDVTQRGNVLSAIGLGIVAAAVFASIVGGRFAPRRLLLRLSPAAVGSLALLAAFPDTSAWLSAGLLSAAAFSGAGFSYVMADARSLLPPKLAGRGLALMNFFVFLGIGAINTAIGVILDYGRWRALSPVDGYRIVFAFLATLLAVALVVYAAPRRRSYDGSVTPPP